MPKIKNAGTATMRFGEGAIVSGSAANNAGSYSDFSLVLSGAMKIEPGHNAGITFQKTDDELNFIQFKNDDDGTSYNAYLAYQIAEFMYISPGRGADFYVQSRTNIGGDPYTFPFRIHDDGTAKFQKGLSDSATSVADLPGDVAFFVSGSDDSLNSAVFGGDTVVSGTLYLTGSSGIKSLHAYGNISGDYVATIENDENSSGHVLKLLTDGNGSGSRLLEMEDGDGDIIFRARADGRFGFGPDGVDSMGAGTFVVGIDNSSHTADIAISQRLQHLGDSNTYLDFPSNDTFNLVAGGNSFLKYDSGNILINNANANVDTKIMANGGSVALHVDAGENRVGVGTTGPNAKLHVDGSFALKSREVTSFPYDVAADDYVILVAGTGTPRRINLPAKSGQEGRILVIKDATGNAQTNNIEINPDGSENIDGSADKLLNTNRVAATIICATDQWHIIGKYSG